MREKRYDEAMCVFTQQSQIKHRLTDPDATPRSEMMDACVELNATQALGVLEHLIATSPDDQDICRLLESLACMYHSAAFDAGNEDKRQEMLQKADDNFAKAMASSEVAVAGSQIDYGIYILHLHRYEEAIVVLKQVISSEFDNPEAANSYENSEKNNFEDENIINEINRHGIITTFSVAFAYYLLTNIYCDTGQQREAETLLPDFQRLCNYTLKEEDPHPMYTTMHARAYSLLGYSHMAVQEYSKAGQAFGKAAQLAVDDYTMAKENRASCDELYRASAIACCICMDEPRAKHKCH